MPSLDMFPQWLIDALVEGQRKTDAEVEAAIKDSALSATEVRMRQTLTLPNVKPSPPIVAGPAIAVTFEEGGAWHTIANPPELYDPPFAIKFSSGWIWDMRAGWRKVPGT